MRTPIIIDVFVYDRHIGGITVDDHKRFAFLPSENSDPVESTAFLENFIKSAQANIPGRLSNIQLLLKLPTFYRGVVYTELRAN